MAAINFPASPTTGQVYTANGRSWIWNGTSWVANNPVTTGTASQLLANSGNGTLVNVTVTGPLTYAAGVLGASGAIGPSGATGPAGATGPVATTSGQSILAGNNSGGFQNVTIGSGLTYDTGTHILNTTGSGGSGSFAVTNLGGAFTPPATSRLNSDMMGDYLSIIDFGCDPTGASDNTAALNNAISAAKVKGKALYAPAGVYRLDNTITISSGVTIFGDNPIPSLDYRIPPTKGTWFYFNHSGIGFSVTSPCNTVKFRTLGTYRPTQTIPTSVPPSGAPTPVWIPTAMGADFDLATGSSLYIYFEDIMTLNPYVAINMQQQCASVYIDKLKGTPLNKGIVIDFCADTCYVNDIHFWPFWNLNNYNSQGQIDYVQIYQLFNLKGIQASRVDGLFITNYFIFFCNSGIYAYRNAYGTPDLFIANAYIDVCQYGIHIDVGAGTSGTSNSITRGQNVSVNCIASYANTYAIFIAGTSDRASITIDDFYVLNAGNSVVYSGSSTSNNTITVDKVNIIKYSTTDSSRPAFYLDGSNNVAVIEGTPVFKQPTPPAPYYAVANLSCYYEGIGWSIKTPSKSFNTTYINETSRPIFITVIAYLSNNANPSSMTLQVKHPLWASWGIASYVYVTGINGLVAGTVSCFVPPGSSYTVNTTAAMSLSEWNEM